jgi:hypothetical protein
LFPVPEKSFHLLGKQNAQPLDCIAKYRIRAGEQIRTMSEIAHLPTRERLKLKYEVRDIHRQLLLGHLHVVESN